MGLPRRAYSAATKVAGPVPIDRPNNTMFLQRCASTLFSYQLLARIETLLLAQHSRSLTLNEGSNGHWRAAAYEGGKPSSVSMNDTALTTARLTEV